MKASQIGEFTSLAMWIHKNDMRCFFNDENSLLNFIRTHRTHILKSGQFLIIGDPLRYMVGPQFGRVVTEIFLEETLARVRGGESA